MLKGHLPACRQAFSNSLRARKRHTQEFGASGPIWIVFRRMVPLIARQLPSLSYMRPCNTPCFRLHLGMPLCTRQRMRLQTLWGGSRHSNLTCRTPPLVYMLSYKSPCCHYLLEISLCIRQSTSYNTPRPACWHCKYWLHMLRLWTQARKLWGRLSKHADEGYATCLCRLPPRPRRLLPCQQPEMPLLPFSFA
jgi:hypothetical protein